MAGRLSAAAPAFSVFSKIFFSPLAMGRDPAHPLTRSEGCSDKELRWHRGMPNPSNLIRIIPAKGRGACTAYADIS
ncbi:hypothetical protein M2319_000528 [Rhodobium gokarnense]|uniref:Uncharacterized protein n=1 Tax=Rhodobium gokarnense TaxID=364296 RepID=A0ABT3H746_9HYPH|nr:hypothetical protein [Rhodobium gokarnense]